jgi:hypothetical protein
MHLLVLFCRCELGLVTSMAVVIAESEVVPSCPCCSRPTPGARLVRRAHSADTAIAPKAHAGEVVGSGSRIVVPAGNRSKGHRAALDRDASGEHQCREQSQ